MERVTIPAAGHASNLHQPATFNRAVVEFLASLPAGSA
jgi:pimeloyl-ACP methyl ester carboxylesterase